MSEYDEEYEEPSEGGEIIGRMFECAVCKKTFLGMADSLPLCDEHKDKMPKPEKTYQSRISCKKCKFIIIELISHVSMGIQVNVQFCQNCSNNDPDELLIENKVNDEWSAK